MSKEKETIILALETSCDETAAAIIADGRRIMANVVASQIEIHKQYGGVVPEVASRQHVVYMPGVIEEALKLAELTWDNIDALAVANGPGLAGALLVGVNTAKSIAFARGKPLVAVNHLEGHIYANWLYDPRREPSAGPAAPPVAPVAAAHLSDEHADDSTSRKGRSRRKPPEPVVETDAPAFPIVCLIVSGGHTELVLMTGHNEYTLLGRTRDDAAGEAFDKVARILGLGYPGGPAIQKLAATGHAGGQIKFNRSVLPGTADFSFSGLKTAVLYKVEEYKRQEEAQWRGGQKGPLARREGTVVRDIPVADIAAEFQQTVTDILVSKTVTVAREYGARSVILAGGVAANKLLRETLATRLGDIPLHNPPIYLCTDNAAMIGAAAYYRFRRGQIAGLDLDIEPNARLV